MDAVEFLEQLKKRSKSNPDYYGEELNIAHIEPISLVRQVEQWAAEHPVKTRQSGFLKHYPGAQITIDGFLHACPMEVFSDTGINCAAQTCSECRKAFWLAEDEEGELPF